MYTLLRDCSLYVGKYYIAAAAAGLSFRKTILGGSCILRPGVAPNTGSGKAASWHVDTVHQCPLALDTIVAGKLSDLSLLSVLPLIMSSS